jgi:hypothetical protein
MMPVLCRCVPTSWIASCPHGHHLSFRSCRGSRNSAQADSGPVQDSTSGARRQTAGWDSVNAHSLSNSADAALIKDAAHRHQVSHARVDLQQQQRCRSAAQPSHSCKWRQHPQQVAVALWSCRCSSNAAVRHSTGGLRAGRWTDPGRKAAQAAIKQQQPVEHKPTRTTAGRQRRQVPTRQHHEQASGRLQAANEPRRSGDHCVIGASAATGGPHAGASGCAQPLRADKICSQRHTHQQVTLAQSCASRARPAAVLSVALAFGA